MPSSRANSRWWRSKQRDRMAATHQPVEPRRRQAEAEQDGWTGEQDDEDHEQDAEPPSAVRLPPTSSWISLAQARTQAASSTSRGKGPTPV